MQCPWGTHGLAIPTFRLVVADWSFAARREPLAKREDFRFLLVALLWAGYIRPGKILGGSGTLGNLGRVWALCGGSQLPVGSKETLHPREILRLNALLCKRTQLLERTDPAEQEVWGRQRTRKRLPSLLSLRQGEQPQPAWEARQFFFYAVSRDLGSPEGVQSDPPPRNDFSEPFLWLCKGVTHHHGCLQRQSPWREH